MDLPSDSPYLEIAYCVKSKWTKYDTANQIHSRTWTPFKATNFLERLLDRWPTFVMI